MSNQKKLFTHISIAIACLFSLNVKAEKKQISCEYDTETRVLLCGEGNNKEGAGNNQEGLMSTPTGTAKEGAIAIGRENIAEGKNSVSVGFWNNAFGEKSVAVGHQNGANSDNSVAMGIYNFALSSDSIAIGERNFSFYKNDIAIGTANFVAANPGEEAGENTSASMAVGHRNHIGKHGETIKNSSGFGVGNVITSSNATAVGVENDITADGAVVLGNKGKATVENSVVLGSSSNASRGKLEGNGQDKPYLAENNQDKTWYSTAGEVAIGDVDAGITRQITGLAAGSADTDAVNVAQLKAAISSANGGGNDSQDGNVEPITVTNGTSNSAKIELNSANPLAIKGENGITTEVKNDALVVQADTGKILEAITDKVSSQSWTGGSYTGTFVPDDEDRLLTSWQIADKVNDIAWYSKGNEGTQAEIKPGGNFNIVGSGGINTKITETEEDGETIYTLTISGNGGGPDNDLTNYVQKTELEGYAKKDDLNGYLTEHQSLEGYVTTAQLTELEKKLDYLQPSGNDGDGTFNLSGYAKTADVGKAKTEAVTEANSYTDTETAKAKTEAVTESGKLADAAKKDAVTEAGKLADAAKKEAVTEAGKLADTAKKEAVEEAGKLADTAKEEAVEEAGKLANTAKEEAVTEAGKLADAAKKEAVTEAGKLADAAKKEAVEEAGKLADTAKKEAVEEAGKLADTAKKKAVEEAGKLADAAKKEAVTEAGKLADTAKKEAVEEAGKLANTAKEEAVKTSADYTDKAISEALIENGNYSPITLSGDEGSFKLESGGEAAFLGDGKNISTVAENGAVKIQLNNNIEVDSVRAGNTVLNSQGLQVAGTKVSENGVSLASGVALTDTGLDNAGYRVTNVGNAVEATDAVNLGQMRSEIASAVAPSLGAMESRLNSRIDSINKDVNAGNAQSLAAASMATVAQPGGGMMAISGGTYGGQQGYAVGYSQLSDSGNIAFRVVGSGNSRGKYGAAASVGFKLF